MLFEVFDLGGERCVLLQPLQEFVLLRRQRGLFHRIDFFKLVRLFFALPFRFRGLGCREL